MYMYYVYTYIKTLKCKEHLYRMSESNENNLRGNF